MSKRKIYFFILFYMVYIFSNYVYATIEITSPSAVVICQDTGRILYEKNANEKRPMASLTKLMTAILLVENCDLTEEISVESAACYVGGSEAGIKPNDTVTAKALLYGMLLPSGNDCAMAIAYHIGGTIDNFASLMNKKAEELGLKATSFANPHGLDNDNHYTTAYEMALIAKYAFSYSQIKEAVATKETYVNFGSTSTYLHNTNSLLSTYSKATGGKTGFTNGANRCLVASATDDNLNLIAVVLGSETSAIRFSETKAILEDTFQNYSYYDISSFLNVYINIPITKGNEETYIATYSDEAYEALTEEEYSKIYVSENFITNICAPMTKGTYIGTYTVSIDDEILYSKDFCLEYDIIKKNVFDYFITSLKNMFKTVEMI